MWKCTTLYRYTTPHYHYYALLSCLVLSLSIAVAVLYLPFGTAQQRQKTRFTVLFQNPIRHHVRINSKTAEHINKQQNNKRSVHPSPLPPTHSHPTHSHPPGLKQFVDLFAQFNVLHQLSSWKAMKNQGKVRYIQHCVKFRIGIGLTFFFLQRLGRSCPGYFSTPNWSTFVEFVGLVSRSTCPAPTTPHFPPPSFRLRHQQHKQQHH